MNYILDVDTGIDDAVAIMYALSIQKPLAITTCFGNIEVDQATNNTIALLEKLQVNIPVYKGSGVSFEGETIDVYAKAVHGNDGLANVGIQAVKSAAQQQAADYLIEAATQYGKELVIVATGPLTNIALALQKNKEAMATIQKLIIMGGAVNVNGNVTPYAEANIYSDVKAADYVFASGLPIELVGLDVTMQAVLPKDSIAHWANGKELQRFCYEILTFYMQAYETFYPGMDGCALHDPLAVASLFYPQWLQGEQTGIVVELVGDPKGRTMKDIARPPITVWTSVETETFIKHFIERLDKQLQ